jgi:hypothetical protein
VPSSGLIDSRIVILRSETIRTALHRLPPSVRAFEGPCRAPKAEAAASWRIASGSMKVRLTAGCHDEIPRCPTRVQYTWIFEVSGTESAMSNRDLNRGSRSPCGRDPRLRCASRVPPAYYGECVLRYRHECYHCPQEFGLCPIHSATSFRNPSPATI